jgi:hypothetical protein
MRTLTTYIVLNEVHARMLFQEGTNVLAATLIMVKAHGAVIVELRTSPKGKQTYEVNKVHNGGLLATEFGQVLQAHGRDAKRAMNVEVRQLAIDALITLEERASRMAEMGRQAMQQAEVEVKFADETVQDVCRKLQSLGDGTFMKTGESIGHRVVKNREYGFLELELCPPDRPEFHPNRDIVKKPKKRR